MTSRGSVMSSRGSVIMSRDVFVMTSRDGSRDLEFYMSCFTFYIDDKRR